MTREDAIKFANCLKNNYTIDFNNMTDFCDMAIKALEQQANTEMIIKTTIKEYLDKFYPDTNELLIDLNHDLCKRIRKAKEIY